MKGGGGEIEPNYLKTNCMLIKPKNSWWFLFFSQFLPRFVSFPFLPVCLLLLLPCSKHSVPFALT